MTEQNQSQFVPGCDAGTSEPEPASVLAIGDIEQWQSSCGNMPAQDGVRFAALEDVDEALLSMMGPKLVVSPVVASSFDCLDVSSVLHDLGYGGSYRAVTRRLPNPDIVRREVRLLCPTLDFDVVTVGSKGFFAN